MTPQQAAEKYTEASGDFVQEKLLAEHFAEYAKDILAENARLREALEAIIQRAKTADFFREKHNISHMGMISMSDPLLIAAQAALAARGM